MSQTDAGERLRGVRRAGLSAREATASSRSPSRSPRRRRRRRSRRKIAAYLAVGESGETRMVRRASLAIRRRRARLALARVRRQRRRRSRRRSPDRSASPIKASSPTQPSSRARAKATSSSATTIATGATRGSCRDRRGLRARSRARGRAARRSSSATSRRASADRRAGITRIAPAATPISSSSCSRPDGRPIASPGFVRFGADGIAEVEGAGRAVRAHRSRARVAARQSARHLARGERAVALLRALARGTGHRVRPLARRGSGARLARRERPAPARRQRGARRSPRT